MSAYLDTSFLVALFTEDPFTFRADQFLQSNELVPVVSDLAAAEFAGVIARHVRTGEITRASAHTVFSQFDSWAAEISRREAVTTEDMAAAEASQRRLDLTLRTIDAIHIALAQRIGATLVTFDQRMADSARALGVSLAAA